MERFSGYFPDHSVEDYVDSLSDDEHQTYTKGEPHAGPRPRPAGSRPSS